MFYPSCPLSRKCLGTIDNDNTNYSIKIELKSDLEQHHQRNSYKTAQPC